MIAELQMNKFTRLGLWILILMPIWLRFGALPIQLWDESRLAINALEMYENHDWITTYYNGQPDLWNTKPPLLIWLEVLSFKIFGVSEWALRLPSVIAGTACCVLLYWFITRISKNRLLAFMSLAVLVTSYGFIKYHHSVRTGDYDSLLTFLTTSYVICYYLFLEEGKVKFLLLSIVCITLAVLVKSVAGLFFIPGLLIYTIYRRKVLEVLRSPMLYLGLLFFAVFVVGYYWLREHHHAGYLKAVMENELGGRMFGHLDNTEKRIPVPFYYYDLITQTNFRFWYVFLPFGILFGYYAKERAYKNNTVLLVLLCALFYLIIAFASNKHDWYDMPLYPFLAFLVAIGIYALASMLSRLSVWEGALSKNVLPYLFVLFWLVAYLHMLTNSIKPDPGEWAIEHTSACRYLKAIYHGIEAPPTDRNIVVAMNDEYQANVEWYAKVLKRRQVNLILTKYDQLQPHPFVMVYNDKLFWKLEADYDFVLQRRLLNDRVRIYQVNGKRHPFNKDSLHANFEAVPNSPL